MNRGGGPDPAEGGGSFISRVREEQMLVERVELLEQAPLFSVLHPTDLRTLASRFHPVRYGRGEVIFREGEPAERLFLIDSGRVKLSISDSEASVSYRCSIDGTPATGCGSSPVFTGVKKGKHTISVWAVDAAGNVSSATTVTFKVL